MNTRHCGKFRGSSWLQHKWRIARMPCACQMGQVDLVCYEAHFICLRVKQKASLQGPLPGLSAVRYDRSQEFQPSQMRGDVATSRCDQSDAPDEVHIREAENESKTHGQVLIPHFQVLAFSSRNHLTPSQKVDGR